MREIQITADRLVSSLLVLSGRKQICLLDSCAATHQNSHLLIAGIEPIETFYITNETAAETLEFFNQKLAQTDTACIFTISYDFGLKIQNIKSRCKEFSTFTEPDIFLAVFDCLVIHDYKTGKTFLTGNDKNFDEIEMDLLSADIFEHSETPGKANISSNFTPESYILTVKKIQDFIRRGETYQTNLTQQIRARLPKDLSAQQIFWRLRKSHPAPFAAFIKRENDFVISISPERFLKTKNEKREMKNAETNQIFHTIEASPIKGTRRRGKSKAEDSFLRNELLNSVKDCAENVMIVDLLRNDIGRICDFGSVKVEKLCELETHPTLFHLVSTVSGKLVKNVNFADIIKAVFPCGSITGAPKIRTMRIIDELETAPRGLSMGAIGYSIPNSNFQIPNSEIFNCFDMSVAIRTMVVRGHEAIFNVGGGIVIDSVPENEYAESLLKAQALLNAVNGKINE